MKKTKRTTSARIVGTIAGIVVGAIISLVCLTGNWDHYEEFSLAFSKGTATKYSDYYSISSSCDVAAYQSSGTSSMKYTFYYKNRSKSQWNTIKSGVTFKKNGEDNTIILGNYPGATFLDVQIKGYKTAGTDTYSKICGFIGY